MPKSLHNGIEIKVKSKYIKEYSNPNMGMHYFMYNIIIQNRNPFTVQLLSRHWIITDSADRIKEVIGEGVVGKQPILKTNEYFEYTSACDFKAGIGTMHGKYTFKNLETGETFRANIPTFINEAKYILN
jgi:ApaG protein